MRTLIGRTVVLAVVVAGAVACQRVEGAQDESTRNDAGTILDEGEVGVFQLEVGDCFDNLIEETVSSVHGVPCAEPHDGQIYAAWDVSLPDDEFPGDDAMFVAAFDGCNGRVPAGLADRWGVDETFGPYVIQPNAQSWELGDREVMCVAVRVDGTQFEGDLL